MLDFLMGSSSELSSKLYNLLQFTNISPSDLATPLAISSSEADPCLQSCIWCQSQRTKLPTKTEDANVAATHLCAESNLRWHPFRETFENREKPKTRVLGSHGIFHWQKLIKIVKIDHMVETVESNVLLDSVICRLASCKKSRDAAKGFVKARISGNRTGMSRSNTTLCNGIGIYWNYNVHTTYHPGWYNLGSQCLQKPRSFFTF